MATAPLGMTWGLFTIDMLKRTALVAGALMFTVIVLTARLSPLSLQEWC